MMANPSPPIDWNNLLQPQFAAELSQINNHVGHEAPPFTSGSSTAVSFSVNVPERALSILEARLRTLRGALCSEQQDIAGDETEGWRRAVQAWEDLERIMNGRKGLREQEDYRMSTELSYHQLPLPPSHFLLQNQEPINAFADSAFDFSTLAIPATNPSDTKELGEKVTEFIRERKSASPPSTAPTDSSLTTSGKASLSGTSTPSLSEFSTSQSPSSGKAPRSKSSDQPKLPAPSILDLPSDWEIRSFYDWVPASGESGHWHCKWPGCQAKNARPGRQRPYGVYASASPNATDTRKISSRAKQHYAKHVARLASTVDTNKKSEHGTTRKSRSFSQVPSCSYQVSFSEIPPDAFPPPIAVGIDSSSTGPPVIFKSGTILEGYTIKVSIWRTGYPFEAVRNSDGLEVALKLIELPQDHDFSLDQAQAEVLFPKLRRPGARLGTGMNRLKIPFEAFALLACRHQTVIEYVDLFEAQGYYILVTATFGTIWPASAIPLHRMAYPPIITSRPITDVPTVSSGHPQGRTLKCCLRRYECLKEGMAKYVLAQVIEAVLVLAQNGFRHHHITEETILITHNLEIKLASFKHVSLIGENPPCHREPHYLAPEEMEASSANEPLAGEWAFGVLLYRLLTGKSPFADVEAQYRGRILPLDRHVGIEVLDLLRRCLETDATKRLTFEEIRKHPWFTSSEDS